MPNFAVIENNTVINIIVADTLEVAEAVTNSTCVEYVSNNAGMGFTYIDGEFVTPPVEEPTND